MDERFYLVRFTVEYDVRGPGSVGRRPGIPQWIIDQVRAEGGDVNFAEITGKGHIGPGFLIGRVAAGDATHDEIQALPTCTLIPETALNASLSGGRRRAVVQLGENFLGRSDIAQGDFNTLAEYFDLLTADVPLPVYNPDLDRFEHPEVPGRSRDRRADWR